MAQTYLQKIKAGHEWRQVARAAFPEYRGRRIHFSFCSQFMADNLSWEGGSKNEYALVNLNTGTVSPMFQDPKYSFPGTTDELFHPIPKGHVVVKHSTFCGEDTGLTVYAPL